MRRRKITLGAAALVVLGAGIAAGCGSQGTASPVPQTISGSVPQSSTPTTPTAKGDPVAGKAVYAGNGCGGCHTFKAAGSAGTVGPDLDKLPDYAAKAGEPLVQFTAGAITHPPPTYVPPGFPKNVMPTTFGQTIKAQDLANLVAFLTQKS